MLPFARRALQFLSNLLVLFALAMFMVLPVRSLYFLSLALITIAAVSLIIRKPLLSRRTWIWLWSILLVEHVIRYAFYPVGLLRILAPMAMALLLLGLASKATKRSIYVPTSIGAVALFALMGIGAYGLYMPIKKQNANPNGPVVFLGDSLTAGDNPDATDSMLYTAQLGRTFATPMVNAGRAGDLSRDALARLEEDVLPKNPRLVVVLIGGNDILTPVPRSELKANVSEIIRRITDRGINAVLVEVPGGFLWDQYYGTYAEVARRHGANLVGEGMLRRIFAFSWIYTTDGIHLSDKGHSLVAQRLGRVLRKVYQIQ